MRGSGQHERLDQKLPPVRLRLPANFEDSPATTTCTIVGQRSSPAPTSRFSVDQIEPRIKVNSSTLCSERNKTTPLPLAPLRVVVAAPAEHSAPPVLGIEAPSWRSSPGNRGKACRAHTQVQARHGTVLFAWPASARSGASPPTTRAHVLVALRITHSAFYSTPPSGGGIARRVRSSSSPPLDVVPRRLAPTLG